MKKENRIRNDLNNDTSVWWLRSTNSYNVGSVAYVYNYGDVSGFFCGDGFGVVPSFII